MDEDIELRTMTAIVDMFANPALGDVEKRRILDYVGARCLGPIKKVERKEYSVDPSRWFGPHAGLKAGT